MSKKSEREFCYGEHVVVRDTPDTRKRNLGRKTGAVVATAGHDCTSTVAIFFGDDTVVIPAHAVAHA